MKGLLYKNCKNVASVIWYYVAFAAVFFAVGCIGGSLLYLGSVGIMMCVIVPLASFACDERENWDAFALSSGISRRQLVMSRYLFSALPIIACALLSALTLFFAEDMAASAAQLLFFAGMWLIAVSVLLPLVHAYGAEKARIQLTLIMVVIFAAGLTAGIFLFGEDAAFELPVFALPSAVFAVGVAFAAVSPFLSVSIMNKKDL